MFTFILLWELLQLIHSFSNSQSIFLISYLTLVLQCKFNVATVRFPNFQMLHCICMVMKGCPLILIQNSLKQLYNTYTQHNILNKMMLLKLSSGICVYFLVFFFPFILTCSFYLFVDWPQDRHSLVLLAVSFW